jgi:hypothetical protein
VLLSDWDFHPIVGAHFQAHISNRFAVKYSGLLANFFYDFAPFWGKTHFATGFS